jgi:hypothetical protein
MIKKYQPPITLIHADRRRKSGIKCPGNSYTCMNFYWLVSLITVLQPVEGTQAAWACRSREAYDQPLKIFYFVSGAQLRVMADSFLHEKTIAFGDGPPTLAR